MWTLHLGARNNWHLPFPVLFGQRGWFDQFPTTIDAESTTVDLKQIALGVSQRT
jgi:hypothetical protein